MTIPLDAIRGALDGVAPATVATCSADGVPNISFVSQVYYVDPENVALSFQFFNKTRQNVLATRRATALVIEADSFARYRIALEYLRIETSGPLFERMKAHLAGIASHTGMAGVFRLQGADVYRVLAIERVAGSSVPAVAPQRHHLAAVRAIAQRIAGCADLSNLLDEALAALDDSLGIRHAMILMADARARKLFTVASRGYEASGVGSEIAFGDGVIGVAAREMTPIRIAPTTGATAGRSGTAPPPGGWATCSKPKSWCQAWPIRAASWPCRWSSAARSVRYFSSRTCSTGVSASTTRTRWWRWRRCSDRRFAACRNSPNQRAAPVRWVVTRPRSRDRRS